MKKRKLIIANSKKYARVFYLKPEEEQRLHEIRLLLQKNPAGHFTIQQLSKIALMNDFKLKKGFKYLFKKSIHDFHLTVRLARAKKFLAETDLTLEEIADKTGYEHTSSFIVAFKKVYSLTPGKFRVMQLTR